MLLAWLRHGSNALLAIAVAALAAAFAAGALPFAWYLVPAGAALFFVAEYVTHRFAFHAPPSKVRLVRAFQHRMHYDHHRDPQRLDLLFLAWWFVIPTAALYFGAFLLIARGPGGACSLLLGMLIALTYYEWAHYVAHVPYVPRSRWARWMKKYHLWHHFKDEHRWFGVTNPSMDLLAGTYADVGAVPRSGTTRDLFG